MTSFTASIAAWSEKAKEQMREIALESVQDVVEDATRNVPVDHGFLRNSLVSEINGSGQFPATKPASDTDSGTDNSGAVALSIAGAEIGDALQFAWTAVYARRVNSGFVGKDSLGRSYNQKARLFLEGATARWQEFVNANAAKVK